MTYQMAHPYFHPDDIPGILEKIEAILRGDEMLSQGRFVREFETAFANYCGATHAVGVNSCSAALEISLRCLNLNKEDEIIVPAETFVATAASVLREGATPIFADIDPNTFCLSLKTIQQALTPKTKAIIIVHMSGMITPDIFDIQAFCKENGIALIEDAAHTPGATIDGIKAGNLGDFGCFSFYPTKIMTTGEGGMLTTSNEDYYALANSYRHRGRDLTAKVEQYARLGTNNRMTEITAVLGLAQLSRLEACIQKRNALADAYYDALAELHNEDIISLLPRHDNIRHAYWRFIVKLHPSIDRVKLQAQLRERGVASDWAYAPAVHLQPVFKTLSGTHEGMLPVSEKIMQHFICLPMHPQITPNDVNIIAKHVSECLTEITA